MKTAIVVSLYCFTLGHSGLDISNLPLLIKSFFTVIYIVLPLMSDILDIAFKNKKFEGTN